MDTEAGIASQVARLVVGEDFKSLKIAVVRDGRLAGLVVELLTRSHGLQKKGITQLGYTASDQQIDSLMRQRNRIIVSPEAIFRHRLRVFYPPSDTTRVSVINGLADRIQVHRRDGVNVPFEFVNQEFLDWPADRIRCLYSYVAASTTPDPEVIEQITQYAWNSLRETDSSFRQLFSQAEQENTSVKQGVGLADSPQHVAQAFSEWLGSWGVDTTFIGELVDKWVFIFTGSAQNPRDGNVFQWSVSVYFDVPLMRLKSVG